MLAGMIKHEGANTLIQGTASMPIHAPTRKLRKVLLAVSKEEKGRGSLHLLLGCLFVSGA